jgi:glycerol-3-phosphate cytidylyltransferase-like family protein
MTLQPVVVKPFQKDHNQGLSYSKSHLINSQVYIEISTGIVIPDYESEEYMHVCLSKIKYTLEDIRDAITKAKEDNKYILLLPGSFDLLHIGHVAYIEKSVETFCQQANCKKRDVFVVVLADDDSLIRHVKSYKHVDFGGSETEHRPVENSAERLVSLSSLGVVDVVGIIPSAMYKELLPAPIEIPIASMVSELITNYKTGLDQSIKAMEYDKKVERKFLLQAHNDVEDLKTGLIYYNFMQKNWSDSTQMHYPVQSWQLYVMSLLNNMSEINQSEVTPFTRGQITRFVNTEDVKYLNQVLYLMQKAGIAVVLFEYKLPEKSTSETISWATSHAEKMRASEKISPWEIIRNHKKSSFDEMTYQDFLTAVEHVHSKIVYK